MYLRAVTLQMGLFEMKEMILDDIEERGATMLLRLPYDPESIFEAIHNRYVTFLHAHGLFGGVIDKYPSARARIQDTFLLVKKFGLKCVVANVQSSLESALTSSGSSTIQQLLRDDNAPASRKLTVDDFSFP